MRKTILEMVFGRNAIVRMVFTFSGCLFKESIPAIPFGNSKHPLPTRSRFLRAAVRSTRSALWLHHAHPFVAAAEKKLVSYREAEWSPICGLQDLLQCSDCALSCAM